MAIHTSPIFSDFRASVNRQLLLRQRGSKTVISKFPDRSKVIYSERQKQAQKRFSEAVSFARVVIKEPGLKDIYRIKASLLGFRSAWNLAIAEFMSNEPLTVKKRKIRFDKKLINTAMGWNMSANLYKYAENAARPMFIIRERIRSPLSRRVYHGTTTLSLASINVSSLLANG